MLFSIILLILQLLWLNAGFENHIFSSTISYLTCVQFEHNRDFPFLYVWFLSEGNTRNTASDKLNGHFFFSQWVMFDSLQPDKLEPTRFLSPQDFPGKNTGVGWHFLLQGVFLTQILNLHLLHWQVHSLPQSHQGSLLNLAGKHKTHTLISYLPTTSMQQVYKPHPSPFLIMTIH